MEQFELTEALKEKLNSAETLDDVVRICAEEGIEVTKEELVAASAADGELNEDDLGSVSGGCVGYVVAAVAIITFWRIKKAKDKLKKLKL